VHIEGSQVERAKLDAWNPISNTSFCQAVLWGSPCGHFDDRVTGRVDLVDLRAKQCVINRLQPMSITNV